MDVLHDIQVLIITQDEKALIGCIVYRVKITLF